MSTIYGALGVNDHERVFLNTLGQRVVYDAVQQVLAEHNADVAAAISILVEETTSDHKLRYKLPGSGRLQRLGNQSQGAAVKAYGGWDVAFPLEEFGAQISPNRIDFAYMTAQDLARHLESIRIQDLNTLRFEMLKALFNSTAGTFVDPLYGSLTIQRLANSDAVVYPPVIGSETEATDTHYLQSGYASSAISDTNDPFTTIVAELEEHFGTPTGGSNVAVFINNAQVAKVKAMTDFDEVAERFVRPGDDRDVPTGLPANVPGRVIGRCSGAWVVEWRFMPANYMMGLHLDAPKPLVQRVDPDYAGLPTGLTLVAESDQYPFTQSHYSHRFGFGVGNRLNGVVMELGTDGSYGVPSGY